MQNLQGYRAILAESQRVSWPESYCQDLYTHDFESLTKDDAPATFGWCLRSSGTFLFRPNSLDMVRACRDQYPYPDGRYYFFDGIKLHEVAANQLITWQEQGTISLLPEKMEVTSQECLALIRKCRELQKEAREQAEKALKDEAEEYFDGKRIAFGSSAVRLDGRESRFLSDSERAEHIKDDRLRILIWVHRNQRNVTSTTERKEKAYNQGKVDGYLEASRHFSELLGMSKPERVPDDGKSRTDNPRSTGRRAI